MAAAMFDPPVVKSLKLAKTLTAGTLVLKPWLPLFGFGEALTLLVIGAVVSVICRLMVATAPQFPNASWLRTETTCVPMLSPAGIVAVKLLVGEGNPTAVIVAGEPPSTQYSAAVTFVLPVAVSSPVAVKVTLTEPLLGFW